MKKDISKEFPKKQEGKLNIYFHVSENSGVGFYRQYQPAIKLRDKGLAQVMINDFKWGEGEHVEPDVKTLFEIANWADIIVVGRQDLPNFYSTWGGIREFFNLPIVMDSDDNVHFVRPTNPGYRSYYPGSDNVIWNTYAVGKVFDALTVSTKSLQDYYRKYNPKIYHLPNNIDLDWWDSFKPGIKKSDKVRIGFIGSAAHIESINLIKPSLKIILEKYPNTRFCVTHIFESLLGDLPKDQVEYLSWTPLKEWPKGLAEANLDIGVAPLMDNLFNRGKSNLRWMEYSATGIPTVASAVEPYLCIKDGIDGLLVKERGGWVGALEKLILDPNLRQRMSDLARKRIEDDFSIDSNIGLWYNAYKEIHKKFHDFFGDKKRFVKSGNKYQEIRYERR